MLKGRANTIVYIDSITASRPVRDIILIAFWEKGKSRCCDGKGTKHHGSTFVANNSSLVERSVLPDARVRKRECTGRKMCQICGTVLLREGP